jgi:hypothetical protein
MEVREMTKLIELAFLPSMYPEQKSIIVLVSLYFACYAATWKGYIRIFNRLKNRILELSASTPNWLRPFALEAVRALDMFCVPENEARIYALGHRFLNSRALGSAFPASAKHGKLYPLDDGITHIPMEVALMWFDLTPFSPGKIPARHFVL